MGRVGEDFYNGGGKTNNTKTNSNTNVNANKTNGYGGTIAGATTGAGKTVTPSVTPSANTSAGYGGTIAGATTGAGTKASQTIDVPINYNSYGTNKANSAGYYQGGGVTKTVQTSNGNTTANTSAGYGGTPNGMVAASTSTPVTNSNVKSAAEIAVQNYIANNSNGYGGTPYGTVSASTSNPVSAPTNQTGLDVYNSSGKDSATDANLMKQEQIDMRKKGIITNNIATDNEDKGDVGGQGSGTEDGTEGDWIGGGKPEDVWEETTNKYITNPTTITSGTISTDSLISQLVDQLTGGNSELISPDVLTWAQAYAQALANLGGTYDANVKAALDELKNKALKSGFYGQANYDMMVAKALQSGELEKNTAIANLAQELVGQSKEDAQNTIENWLNNKQITVNGLYDLLALVAKYNSTTEETTSGVDEEGNSYSRTTKTKTYM